jgi:DNA integrity scanning protein DisA with diadenylate cyclase activity
MNFWEIAGTVFAVLVVVLLWMISYSLENLASMVKQLNQFLSALDPMRAYFDRKNQQAEEAEREFRRRESDLLR